MSQDDTRQIPESVTQPLNILIGGAGIGLLLAAAGFAFLRSRQSETGSNTAAEPKLPLPKLGKPSLKSKWVLTSAIRLIEHDSSRKVLLTVLKSMANRAK